MMESQQIKPGDVVRLKSSGPLMTVSDIQGLNTDSPFAWCVWFPQSTEDGRLSMTNSFELQRAEVPCMALELVETAPIIGTDDEKSVLKEELRIQIKGLSSLLNEARKRGYLVDVHTDTGWVELPKIVSARIFQLLKINTRN